MEEREIIPIPLECECRNWARIWTKGELEGSTGHHPNCIHLAKKTVFKLDPDYTDGSHWSIAESENDLLELVKTWLDDNDLGNMIGESLPDISIIEMTQEDIDCLKDL